jgi:hydrogenase maturation factor
VTTTDSTPRCDARDGSCHLCGDEAVAGRVLVVDAESRTATVAFADGAATVALDLVDAGVGDRLLVHLGFAIARLEPGDV